MLQLESHGIQSAKFLDITKLQHRFPEQIKSIGFSVTLLHNHPHCKTNQVLLYDSNYKVARYVDQNLKEYSPCSWYMEGDQVIPYEFTTEAIETQEEEIKERLVILEKAGYKNYGVTVRPIQNVVEVETKEGHKYYDQEAFKMQEDWKFSETAMNGKMVDGCYSYSRCVITSSYAHATDYGHDVY